MKMTTFQAIVYGIIHGFAEFLPIGVNAHDILIPDLLGWPSPTGVLLGSLKLGALLALLIYFRHDWASMLSSFLQVILFWKRPMTLDERLPFFIFITTLPIAGLWYYLPSSIFPFLSTPSWVAIELGVLSVAFWIIDSLNRKSKAVYNINWLDSLLIGIGQTLTLVPGGGRSLGALGAALTQNYNRETAVKFTFFSAMPFLMVSAFFNLKMMDFHSSQPMPDLSWLSFFVAILVSLLSGLLAIGGLLKHIQRKGFSGYMLYRLFLAVGFGIVYWMRTR